VCLDEEQTEDEALFVIYNLDTPMWKVLRDGAWSKAWVYGCRLSGIASSNPARGLDFSFL